MTDAQVERVRDDLAGIARVALDGFRRAGEQHGHEPGAAIQAIPAHLIEGFEERAGIMEFDGGLTRDEADRRAVALVLQKSTKGAP